MYYIYTDTVYPGAMKRLIDQLIKVDKKDDTPFPAHDDLQSSHDCQPKKHRKYSTRVIKVTPTILCDAMGVNINRVENSIDTNQKLYETFRMEQFNGDNTTTFRIQ